MEVSFFSSLPVFGAWSQADMLYENQSSLVPSPDFEVFQKFIPALGQWRSVEALAYQGNCIEPLNQNALKAAKNKLMNKDTETLRCGQKIKKESLVCFYEGMRCYACLTSWITSCGGCHLPVEVSQKTECHHYEEGSTQNFATDTPQVTRNQMFLIGKCETSNYSKYASVWTSSALARSSANRENIYMQQQSVAASGSSSQAFNSQHLDQRLDSVKDQDEFFPNRNITFAKNVFEELD